MRVRYRQTAKKNMANVFGKWPEDEEESVSKGEGDAMLTPTMPNLRQSILDELKRREWSAYRLIQELKGKRPKGRDVPPATVYEFVRGETTINSDDLGLIFDALDLVPKRKR